MKQSTSRLHAVLRWSTELVRPFISWRSSTRLQQVVCVGFCTSRALNCEVTTWIRPRASDEGEVMRADFAYRHENDHHQDCDLNIVELADKKHMSHVTDDTGLAWPGRSTRHGRDPLGVAPS